MFGRERLLKELLSPLFSLLEELLFSVEFNVLAVDEGTGGGDVWYG